MARIAPGTLGSYQTSQMSFETDGRQGRVTIALGSDCMTLGYGSGK
jgi:hypothetical protein